MHALALTPWAASLGAAVPALAQTLAGAGLIWVLSRAGSPGQAGLLTWLYATVWLIGGTGWMYVSLHRYGELPAWLSAFAVVALCVCLSGYMGLAGWAWARWRHHRWWRDAMALAGCWMVAEWARTVIFTGFPWAASGYGLIDTPWVKAAPWLGVYGMGGAWIGLIAALVLGLRERRARTAYGLFVGATLVGWVLLATSTTRSFTTPVGQRLSVTLLQSNVPQEEKFTAEHQVPMLLWHAQQLLSAHTDLVVAPETAIPLLPSQLPPAYWEQIKAGFMQPGRAALIGVPLGDFDHGYTNSAVGLSSRTTTQPDGMYRYDKHHLVPFGEVIPWGFHWFVQMMNMPLGDFNRGPLVAPSFVVTDQRVAPTVCYEDLFGEEIAARFVQPSQAPTILANVSNLAWFGESVAIHQHLQIARLRSLEFQLPTLRATNTGATVVIDHRGQVTAALPSNTRGALVAGVQGREGVTPFAWWAGRFGLWPVLALGLLLAVPWGAPRREGAQSI